MTRLTRNPVSWVIAANVGLFVWLAGGRIVWPGHVSWLMWGDSAQHYLGWEFFRRGPLSVWPPGASPLFGVGYSSSVVYADAIPLLALPMKFFLAFTDVRFQYLGAWLLACFILQGVFAVKLLKRFGVSGVVLVPGALLFSIAPVFLYRMVIGGHGHMALAGHFLVLWALWLVLDPQLSHRRWAAVLLVSLLVQFYLFAMVAYLYVVAATWWAWRHRRERPLFVVIRGAAGNICAILVLAYLAGYFMSGSTEAEGFGMFRSDVLGLIDPNPYEFQGWSELWTRLVDQKLAYQAKPFETNGTFEGYAFVGIATLLVMPVIPIAWVSLRDKSFQVMAALMTLVSFPLFLLAVSNQIHVGGTLIWNISVPREFERFTSTLRASGRFMWPLVYCATCLSVVALVRVVVRCTKKRQFATILLVVLILFQLFDMRVALSEYRERFTEAQREVTRLQDVRWTSLAAGTTCLVVVPVEAKGPSWLDFAEFALDNGLTTNSAYLSRWSQAAVEREKLRVETIMRNRSFDSECLYVAIPPIGENLESEIEQLRIAAGRDSTARTLVELLDGLIVIRRLPVTSAPG